MLTKMKRQVFDSLEDSALGGVCFEPIIPMVRGKDITVKKNIYRQLTSGQKALFMFFAYYNHARNSLAEFYWWTAYYYAQPQAWSEIKAGLRYFKANAMLQLFEKAEELLNEKKFSNRLEGFNVSYKDLDNDPELFTSMTQLSHRFQEITPDVLKKIGEHIKCNPNEYIQFEDE